MLISAISASKIKSEVKPIFESLIKQLNKTQIITASNISGDIIKLKLQ